MRPIFFVVRPIFLRNDILAWFIMWIDGFLLKKKEKRLEV